MVAAVVSSFVVTSTGVAVAAPADAAPKRVAAISLLAKIRVSNETGASSYDRDNFKHWVDKKGKCDTRAIVLKEESTKRTTQNSNCTIKKGRWVSAYDGKRMSRAKSVQIDHMVPLAEAWRSGARRWSKNQRTAFANDTGYSHTLVGVSARSNQSKGDSDPAEWLPRRSVCSYVAKWTAVKYRWKLTMDRTEYRVVKSRLQACGKKRTMVKKPARGTVKNSGGIGKNSSRRGGSGSGGGSSSVPGGGGYDCPDTHPIKGNADSMIYHVPGGQYYDRTKPEECFKTESAARAAGYRRSER